MKNTLLRATYQKELFSKSGQSIDGFGLLHDGGEENIHTFLKGRLFPSIRNKPQVQNDIAAYNLAIDTGVAPAVGYTETLTSSTVGNNTLTANWNTLESQAAANNCEVIAEGSVNGQITGLLYNPSTKTYTSSASGVGPFTHAQLVTAIRGGSTLTVMGVPNGSGLRMTSRAH